MFECVLNITTISRLKCLLLSHLCFFPGAPSPGTRSQESGGKGAPAAAAAAAAPQVRLSICLAAELNGSQTVPNLEFSAKWLQMC